MTDPAERSEDPAVLVAEVTDPPTPQIVGIGASAGGLEAFTAFLTAMPANSDLAFVLIQHLDPDHPSQLAALLASHTAMPVQPITDRMAVLPNHVYVIPPNTTLTLDRSVLTLVPPTEPHGQRMPIDSFFHSLASSFAERAIGILLSGTGSDGTLGLLAIKEQSGLTLAQDPATAAYPELPESAIGRGLVDYVLPIAAMPAALQATRASAPLVLVPEPTSPAELGTVDALQQIFPLLQQTTGHDFRQYKTTTLLRRIARRMQVLQIRELERYVARLRIDPVEVTRLFQDLLISVTQFFRDPAAFAALAATVIPQLFRAKGSNTPVRVWLAGCATGEEAYTLAILLHEHAARLLNPPPIQVFATDIDEQALAHARQGRYDLTIAAHVSLAHLARYFTSDGQSYQVTKALREHCLFSVHNLIRDPPFARLDLLVCRNVLIYFDADLQQRLFPVLHYALAPGGYLFLGGADQIPQHSPLFYPLDKVARIFQRAETPTRTPIDFPLAALADRMVYNHTALSLVDRATPRTTQADFERMLLQDYVPPGVVIDAQDEILYVSGATSGYLALTPGTPKLHLLTMVHPTLRLALYTAIRAARSAHVPVVRERLLVTTTAGEQLITLIVRPLVSAVDDGRLVVLFQEIGPATHTELVAHTEPDSAPVQQLVMDLQGTRAMLDATIADAQTAQEALMAANEELLSLNEEWQAAKEELQTANEEQQSINEELQIVNNELSRIILERDRAYADLENLFASTKIPALFLDTEARIVRFTPAASTVFRLIPNDIGRLITDIAPRFHNGDIGAIVAQVLYTRTPFEEAVQQIARDGWWLLRVHPYDTRANIIDGVVLTFADITELKQAEADHVQLLVLAQQAQAYAEQIVDAVSTPLLLLDAGLRAVTANQAFYHMFQLTPAETERGLLIELAAGQWHDPRLIQRLRNLLRQDTSFADLELHQNWPQSEPKTLLVSGRTATQPGDVAPLIVLSFEDITARRQSAERLQQAYDSLEQRVAARTAELAAANAALQAEIQTRQQGEQTRHLLLQHLVSAQEEERRRIARELHDQMGQDLTALMLGIKTLQDRAADQPPLAGQLEQLQRLATQMGKEVRSLVFQLRPIALDDVGLVGTLAHYIDDWSARAQIAADFQATGLDGVRLPPTLETTFYRLVQEVLTNVLRHAQATSVSVILTRIGQEVQLIVEDNGVGLDPEAERNRPLDTRRLGLIGMQERVTQFGGSLTVESAPGSGTTIFVRVPLGDAP